MSIKGSISLLGLLVTAALMTGCAATQTAKLSGEPVKITAYYEEVEKGGLIYVFISSKVKAEFDRSGRPDGSSLGCYGYIPNCETVVFESELAMNEYKKRHNIK